MVTTPRRVARALSPEATRRLALGIEVRTDPMTGASYYHVPPRDDRPGRLPHLVDASGACDCPHHTLGGRDCAHRQAVRFVLRHAVPCPRCGVLWLRPREAYPSAVCSTCAGI